MLNNELMINGIPYKVIGVLKSRGSQGWESPDDEVYVPLMTASARIFGSKNLRSIMVKIPNDANVEEAMLYIEGVMRVQHDIGPGQENDFRINDWFQYSNCYLYCLTNRDCFYQSFSRRNRSYEHYACICH